MPLKSGRSMSVVKSNIRELLESYKSSGKIGNVTPDNAAHARRIAIAAAYKKSGRAKN